MVAPGRGRWLIGLALVAGVLVPPATGGADSRAAGCLDDVVPVALDAGRPADQKIVVQLCGPSPLDGRVVHVLISGATYGPSTWDLPYQPERYSYVRAMNEAGIATLNVTRLGMADSSLEDARTFPPVMGESDGIKAPVLDVMGEYDGWFCAAQPCSAPDGTPSRSRQWFDGTSCFEQYVLPEAGHDINVHYTAQQWFAVAVEWTRRMVGAGGPCRQQG